VFGFGKRRRAERELKEIQTWITGQALVLASSLNSTGAATFDGNKEQMAVALEAQCFFLHAVSRLSARRESEKLRETVLDPSARQMAKTFSEMLRIKQPDTPTLEGDLLDLFITREGEYGAASKLLSKEFNDKDSAVWRAAFHVGAAAGIPDRDIRIMNVATMLTESLVRMDLAQRIRRIEASL
jgi:hypothetical protein